MRARRCCPEHASGSSGRPLPTPVLRIAALRRHYLCEIRLDMNYFGKTYRRAGLHVDIAGLDAEASAALIEDRVRGLLGSRE